MQRRRFKQTVSLEERLAEQARHETASHMNDWLTSPASEMRPTEQAPKGTPLIEGAAQVLRQARKLPIGEARNELRHLARIMIRLHRIGFRADIEIMKKHTIH